MPEFTLNEVITATAGKLSVRGNFQQFSGVSIDSRTLVPGAVFFAIQGTNFDGHNYITDAAEKGATAVVCERITDLPSDWPGAVIQVADSLQAFGRLACFHRQRFAVPVIGITGSNGKTTTKELIAAILAEKKRVVKTEKNYNNEIGLPLTLFKMDADTEAVVVEMGMRGMGQIAYLADLAKPTMGVITNIGLTHLELLGTQAAIAAAKAELIQALPVSGWAILNADDPLVAPMASQCKGGSLFYSLQQGSDLSRPSPALFLVDATTKAASEEITVDGRWGKFRFTLPLLGRHNIANALAAATASLALGLTTEEAARGLQKATTAEKRLRIVEVDGITVLDDTYNASPASVQAALAVLQQLQNSGRKIAVLGDMLELGKISKQAHYKIGELVADYGCAAVFTYGPLSIATQEGAARKGISAYHFGSKEELGIELENYLKPGDAVLIKGSRGMEMEAVVEKLIACAEGGER